MNNEIYLRVKTRERDSTKNKSKRRRKRTKKPSQFNLDRKLSNINNKIMTSASMPNSTRMNVKHQDFVEENSPGGNVIILRARAIKYLTICDYVNMFLYK